MPAFSPRSLEQLRTCDERLVLVFTRVILLRDCTIIEGQRNEAAQLEAYRLGKSKLKWPESKHNRTPSLAVDAAPYFKGVGIPWQDQRAFDHFAGLVLGVADQFGVKLRWGGDWDGNGRPGDEGLFHDLPHFELLD